jgi:hypothetical protein
MRILWAKQGFGGMQQPRGAEEIPDATAEK